MLRILIPLLLICAAAIGAPVNLPYAENFASGPGSFSATSGTWTASTGSYRCSITSNTASGAATVEAGQLAGNASTAAGFFISARFSLVDNQNSSNTFGFGMLGTDASFSGGVDNPYYLVDVRPPQNTVRVLRVGINNTEFLPSTRLQTFTMNASQPFTLEVLGTYENGVLRMDVTIRQGTSSDTFIAVDSLPLTGRYFGFRNRTNGAPLTVDCDDFVLRRISGISFGATPTPFARVGVPYTSVVSAVSSTGASVMLNAPAVTSWVAYSAGPNGTGTLNGTPGPLDLGAHAVTLAATDTEDGAAQETFYVSVLEPTGVFISEFLADNSSGIRDEDGDQSDWIEIFNSSDSTVDLGGWWLSDNPLNPRKWAIPSGTNLPSHGFLTVFASDKNRGSSSSELHTNFKLTSSAGGHLSLARPDGTVVSSFTNYPTQRADRSFGTYDSYTPRGYLLNPTPGAPNEPFGYDGFVANPEFSIRRGFFDAPQNVVISCATPGATIVYTRDGSVPSLTNGVKISAPDAITPPQATLTIASTTVLRAAAFASGLAPSGPATQTYLFLSDVIAQSPDGSPPPGWPVGPINSQVLNYGMDPDITGTVSAQQMQDSLKALPTLSLVTELGNLFEKSKGIYVNPYGREEGYECPVSVELLNADGTSGFNIDAGLRIRGGASRVATNPKHNFHLYFRGRYGASKLKYRLFGDEGADEFDRVDLRSTQVISWHQSNTGNATYNRDEWSRYTHAAMGQQYTRSRYYHLYINGHYWGIYGTQERADSDFAASYFGGKKAGYDVMKTYVIPHRVDAADGDNAAWARLHSAAVTGFSNDANYYAVQGLDPNGQPSSTLEPLVDVDNLIDYTLLHYYIGNGDGPVNTSVGVPKNFYAIRPRDGRFGFRFMAHDCEDALNTNTNVSASTSVGQTLEYFNPRYLSDRLAGNAQYRRRFGDRAQKHLYNGGALDPSVAIDRFNFFRGQLSSAILAESARWGDAKRSTPYKVSDWTNANNGVVNNFFPTRREAIISQLRSRNLFPSIAAPSFSQHGGIVPMGYQVTISGPANSTLYYTVDGTDPTAAGAQLYTGPLPIENVQVTLKARAKDSGGTWSALTEAAFTLNAIPAVAGNLAISEIHYNPPGSTDDTEFVELVNISQSRLILAGVTFTEAMIFTFGDMTLEPGERVVVVENETAFRAAYGNAPVVAGQWSGALNNDGETIVLLDRQGNEIERVPFGNASPWPPSADGAGYSLVRIDTASAPSVPMNWRPSVSVGGNPGGSDRVELSSWLSTNGFPTSLSVGTDGTAALIRFVTGRDLAATGDLIGISRDPANHPGALLITLQRRLGADEIGIRLESSADLVTWQSFTPGSPEAPVLSRSGSSSGVESITLRVPALGEKQFLRLRATGAMQD